MGFESLSLVSQYTKCCLLPSLLDLSFWLFTTSCVWPLLLVGAVIQDKTVISSHSFFRSGPFESSISGEVHTGISRVLNISLTSRLAYPSTDTLPCIIADREHSSSTSVWPMEYLESLAVSPSFEIFRITFLETFYTPPLFELSSVKGPIQSVKRMPPIFTSVDYLLT